VARQSNCPVVKPDRRTSLSMDAARAGNVKRGEVQAPAAYEPLIAERWVDMRRNDDNDKPFERSIFAWNDRTRHTPTYRATKASTTLTCFRIKTATKHLAARGCSVQTIYSRSRQSHFFDAMITVGTADKQYVHCVRIGLKQTERVSVPWALSPTAAVYLATSLLYSNRNKKLNGRTPSVRRSMSL